MCTWFVLVVRSVQLWTGAHCPATSVGLLKTMLMLRCCCMCTGSKGFYAVWLYSSICNATFLVRTMKRIIFQEAKQYGELLL